MAYYETILIARQDISASQAEALSDQFIGFLTAEDGKVSRREYWGLKNLAYRIKKNRKGHYTLFNFDAPHSAVQEMERNIRLSEDVLRYITVRTEDLPEEASVMTQRRDDRDSRGSRDGGKFSREGSRDGAREGGRGREDNADKPAEEGDKS